MNNLMPLSSHPMSQRVRPTIQTLPVVRLALATSVCLEYGRPSLRVIGDGRAGKSTATLMLENTTSWRPFSCGFLRMVVGRPAVASEANFFREVALGLGMKVPRITTTQDLLLRIIRAFEQEAARSAAEVVMLAIDTAENLTLKDYEHLAKLQNHFLGSVVQPFFLFIHQSDSQIEGADDLGKAAPPHLYGRFFVDSHDFTGLLWTIPPEDSDQDACDVALAFREFDQSMRWPEITGPTYTEAFAPLAYSAGWRLEKETDAIRRRIEVLCATHGYAMSRDWLMVSFNAFVFDLLTKVAAGRAEFMALAEDDIDTALKRSGFIGFESARRRSSR
ncbi:ATP-binding protein [Stenotrophomonas sp.]|uniref:ATP-binding protein n=1 Tax=Stenotrophomonas sp. TaxID=69392 RepID=UPI002FCA34B8